MHAHGYAAVASELARQLEWEFQHHQRVDNVAEALIAATVVMICWVQSSRTNTGMLDNRYLSRSLANAVRWVRRAQATALAVDAKRAHQEWQMSAEHAARAVQELGLEDFERASAPALTHMMESRMDRNSAGQGRHSTPLWLLALRGLLVEAVGTLPYVYCSLQWNGQPASWRKS
jgi:hypothetical protein